MIYQLKATTIMTPTATRKSPPCSSIDRPTPSSKGNGIQRLPGVDSAVLVLVQQYQMGLNRNRLVIMKGIDKPLPRTLKDIQARMVRGSKVWHRGQEPNRDRRTSNHAHRARVRIQLIEVSRVIKLHKHALAGRGPAITPEFNHVPDTNHTDDIA